MYTTWWGFGGYINEVGVSYLKTKRQFNVYVDVAYSSVLSYPCLLILYNVFCFCFCFCFLFLFLFWFFWWQWDVNQNNDYNNNRMGGVLKGGFADRILYLHIDSQVISVKLYVGKNTFLKNNIPVYYFSKRCFSPHTF